VSEFSDLPDRPAPPQSLLARARGWLEWVGPSRVLGAAVVVLAVLAGAYWLVKPPPTPVERGLPFASSVPPSSAEPTEGTAASSTTLPAEMVVHVAGAVVTAGVYRMPPGSRTIDAVQRAGGLAANADGDAINLAATLADGQRVYVPRVGEVVPLVDAGGVPTTALGPIDLNRATTDELDSLPGVGPATAAAIVAYREQHGPFGRVDDLSQVRGIGAAKLEALRGLVTV
jgi:competence protein ComEA